MSYTVAKSAGSTIPFSHIRSRYSKDCSCKTADFRTEKGFAYLSLGVPVLYSKVLSQPPYRGRSFNININIINTGRQLFYDDDVIIFTARKNGKGS
jgi:hypothetical protein